MHGVFLSAYLYRTACRGYQQRQVDEYLYVAYGRYMLCKLFPYRMQTHTWQLFDYLYNLTQRCASLSFQEPVWCSWQIHSTITLAGWLISSPSFRAFFDAVPKKQTFAIDGKELLEKRKSNDFDISAKRLSSAMLQVSVRIQKAQRKRPAYLQNSVKLFVWLHSLFVQVRVFDDPSFCAFVSSALESVQ